MLNKLLITALCIVAGTMVGLIFSNRLKKRADFFKSVDLFIDTLVSEVSFRKSSIKKIMSDFINANNSLFNNNLNEYVSCQDISSLKLSRGVVNEIELSDIRKFFVSLGRSDTSTQLTELMNYKSKYSQIFKDADEKRKKFGAMYIKLGFFLGIMLGIVLL